MNLLVKTKYYKTHKNGPGWRVLVTQYHDKKGRRFPTRWTPPGKLDMVYETEIEANHAALVIVAAITKRLRDEVGN